MDRRDARRVEGERADVGGGEEDVEVVAARGRGEAALAPEQAAAAAATQGADRDARRVEAELLG